jgi:hypothetical protein
VFFLACLAGIAALTLLGVAANTAPQSIPLRLHPQNPHYFEFRGKPTVLITSGEHYGAVLNLDFDYRKYLDTLAACGLNHTRTFAGAYCEPEGGVQHRPQYSGARSRPFHLPLGSQRTTGIRQWREQVRPDAVG